MPSQFGGLLAVQKTRSGFTLIEIVLSLFVILALISILFTASGTYVSSRNSNLQGIAAKIASRQIETLRKTPYASLPSSGTFTDTDLSKLPGGTATETLSSYQSSTDVKQVTTTVNWVENEINKTISVDTLIYKNGI